MITTFFGYLEAAYLIAPYMSGAAAGSVQGQYQRRIEDSSLNVGFQIEKSIADSESVRSQLEKFIVNETTTGVQHSQRVEEELDIGLQIKQSITDSENFSAQFEKVIQAETPVNTQHLQRVETVSAYGVQIDNKVEASQVIYTEFESVIRTFTPVNIQHEQKSDGSDAVGVQIEGKIESSEAIGSQFEGLISTEKSVNLQTELQIESVSSTGLQIEQNITALNNTGIQHEQRVADYLSSSQSQFDRRIVDDAQTGIQIEQIISATYLAPSQFNRQITQSESVLSEFGRGPVSHAYCDGYLVDGYLTDPYLAPFICAHLRMQHSRAVNVKINTQILQTIYNTTNLRILYQFPSRGTSGTNWTVVSGGTEAGDFSVNNLNSDIVEQVYRSTSKVVVLQCDTEVSQGIFNDTLAILNHNLTSSAVVLMQGSNDALFASVGMSETLDVETENLFWIAEFLPSASYRYWRFTITDTTNANNIQIGTIVFGSSIIFSGECFIDDVVRRKTHFADRVRTEGYSAVSNDRALKRAVGLGFRRLDFNRDNYSNLVAVIDYCRTSLKALWIPTPQFASRFAVFGKLAEIPVENHKALGRDADYIDLDVNVDEAL